MAAFSSVQFAKEYGNAARLACNPHATAELRACLARLDAMREQHPAEAALCEARIDYQSLNSQLAKIRAQLATLTARLPALDAAAAAAEAASQTAHDDLTRLTPPPPSRRKARAYADTQQVAAAWERRTLAPAQRKADRLHAAAAKSRERAAEARRAAWSLRQESETLTHAQTAARAADPRVTESPFPPPKRAARGADRKPRRTPAELTATAIEHAAVIRQCFELTADGRLLRTHFERTGRALTPPRPLTLDTRQNVSVCRGIMLPPQLIVGVLHGLPGHWLAPRAPATTWTPPNLFDVTPSEIVQTLELA